MNIEEAAEGAAIPAPGARSVTATQMGVRYGLIIGGALIVYGIFFRVANIHYSSLLAWVFYLLMPAGVVLVLWAYRKSNASAPAFQPGFWAGSLTSVISAALYSVYVFFYNRFIDDSLLQTIITDFRARFIEQGLTGEQFDSAMEQLLAGASPGLFSIGVFIRLAGLGVLFALVLAPLSRFYRPKS